MELKARECDMVRTTHACFIHDLLLGWSTGEEPDIRTNMGNYELIIYSCVVMKKVFKTKKNA